MLTPNLLRPNLLHPKEEEEEEEEEEKVVREEETRSLGVMSQAAEIMRLGRARGRLARERARKRGSGDCRTPLAR